MIGLHAPLCTNPKCGKKWAATTAAAGKPCPFCGADPLFVWTVGKA